MLHALRPSPRRPRGASALEYALMVVLLVVGLVVFFRQFGDRVSLFSRISATRIHLETLQSSHGQGWANF
ncbi:MAG TPA: hypothetical protein VEI97_15070 [bacterium]|nr:hypothetical protein [bacterium]